MRDFLFKEAQRRTSIDANAVRVERRRKRRKLWLSPQLPQDGVARPEK